MLAVKMCLLKGCGLLWVWPMCTLGRFWESNGDRRGQGSQSAPFGSPASQHVLPAHPAHNGYITSSLHNHYYSSAINTKHRANLSTHNTPLFMFFLT